MAARKPLPGPVSTPPVPAGKPVGAALNTVGILRYAAEAGEPFTATEAARALALNPSTCFNIVQTLVAEGWLEAVEGSKRYAVGAALSGLAHRITAQSRDFGAVRPLMQAVADRWKVTVTLWKRRSPTRMELLLVATCNTAVNIQMPVGQRLPLLVGGMGRILALEGGLDDAQRQALFAQIRWQRPLTLAGFMAQARLARRVGWGLDDGYMHRSVMALSVPVRSGGADAPLDCVCSATMFRHQYAPVVLPDIAAALRPVADRVALLLRG